MFKVQVKRETIAVIPPLILYSYGELCKRNEDRRIPKMTI
jgi:hypothetical protein